MNSIEDRLRESLRDRATDVEPTPRLWERVQREARRRAQLTWLFAGLGVAAVIGALAVAIPALLDDDALPQPDVFDTPPAEPGPDETLPPGTSVTEPAGIVATDGARIAVLDHSGAERAVLLQLDPGACECEITDVAVSPTSTRRGLLVVYTVLAEGMWEHRWLRATSDAGDLAGLTTTAGDYFLDEHAVSAGTAPASTPAVSFSPEGDLVAWIELPASETATPLLRVVAFSNDGPAGEVDSVSIDDLTPRGYAVEDWIWTSDEVTGGEAAELLLTTREEGLEVIRLPIVIGGDGVTALDPELVEASELGAPIDLAFGAGEAEHVLYAGSSGEGSVRFSLWTWSDRDGTAGAQVGPSDAIVETSDPSSGWIDALGDTVLFGHGDQAWIVDATSGETLLLSSTATSGALFAAVPGPSPALGTGPAGSAPTVSVEGLGDVVLRDSEGTVVTTLYDSTCADAEDCEFRPARLAVRPGSTLDDLTVLVLWLGDGAELGWIHAVGDEVTPYTPFPDHLQVDPGVVGAGSLPVPVWSSDGHHVAWLEGRADSSVWGLRVVGWDAGPGTGEPATDNTEWEVGAGARSRDLELAYWHPWTTVDGAERSRFTLRWGSELDVTLAEGLVVERQGDGGLALVDGGFGMEGTEEGLDIDVAVSGDGAWFLHVPHGDGTKLGIQVAIENAAGERRAFDAPLELQTPPTDAWHLWIEAHGDVAYVGDDLSGRVWRVTAEGEFQELEGVRHIAPVR